MKKRYALLTMICMVVCLLAGCALTDRIFGEKPFSDTEVKEEQDGPWEEIPEEERAPEILENLLAQIEESHQEAKKEESPKPQETEQPEAEPQEEQEENIEENTEENTEAEQPEDAPEKDDFSDINLNSYVYSSNRDEFPSDIAFANFRSLSGGEINENMFFRSASPVCNQYNRAPYADAFAEAVGIQCVLNLSDSDEEIAQFMTESGYISPYYKKLHESGKVLDMNMDSRYYSNKFAFTLAEGLRKMLTMEGPVLIHCIEGKDRTGFVALLFEGLAGATYQEILDDYMITYYNYYPGVLEEDDRLYQCIKQTYIDAMIRYISGADENTDLTQLDMHQWCRQYLYNAGLTEEELDKLEERLKS